MSRKKLKFQQTPRGGVPFSGNLMTHGDAVGVQDGREGIKAKATLNLSATNAKYGIKLTKDQHHALRFVSRQERRAFLLAAKRSRGA